ncbi:MAG: helix-turn-helix transcriptional regulator [Caldilineaceae bacterium]
MTNAAIKRIYRAATVEELEDDRRIRAQIAEELPELRQRGQALLAIALQEGGDIQRILAFLKSERIKKGLTLADIGERTGLAQATLSALENSTDANPTIDALTRYADAVGKKVNIILTNNMA